MHVIYKGDLPKGIDSLDKTIYITVLGDNVALLLDDMLYVVLQPKVNAIELQTILKSANNVISDTVFALIHILYKLYIPIARSITLKQWVVTQMSLDWAKADNEEWAKVRRSMIEWRDSDGFK